MVIPYLEVGVIVICLVGPVDTGLLFNGWPYNNHSGDRAGLLFKMQPWLAL